MTKNRPDLRAKKLAKSFTNTGSTARDGQDEEREKFRRKIQRWEKEADELQKKIVDKAGRAKAKEVLGDMFELFDAYRKAPTQAERTRLRNEIVVKNLRLVFAAIKSLLWLLKEQPDPAYDIDDLSQEGVIGILRAMSLYDYTKGYSYTTYFFPWIKQMAQRFIEDNRGVPVHISTEIIRLINVATELQAKLGREPSLEELANAAGTSPAEIEKMQTALSFFFHFTSLDSNTDEDEKNLQKTVPNHTYTPYELAAEQDEADQLKKIVANSLSALSPREQLVIRLRFGLNEKRRGLTLEEIGKVLRLTKERIRQIESKAMTKLRGNELFQKAKKLLPGLISPNGSDPVAKKIPALKKARPKAPQTTTPKAILQEIASGRSVSVVELLHESYLATARQKAIYRLRQELKLPFPKITAIIGYKNDSVAKYMYRAACRKKSASR